MPKSTVEQIRARFDADVERFSNLETGQTATMDAPLIMELVARAASATNPNARAVLDIGCGAGNYTLKLLQHRPGLNCALLDLSRPMLERARERVSAATTGAVVTLQGDIRDLDIGAARYDIVLAAMTLHHLRGEEEWQAVFRKLYAALVPGGSLWIADATEHEILPVRDLLTAEYGDYLSGVGGDAYRDKVFAYIEEEDTPRPLLFQTDLMRRAGFHAIDVLHKNNRYAAFGGIK